MNVQSISSGTKCNARLNQVARPAECAVHRPPQKVSGTRGLGRSLALWRSALVTGGVREKKSPA